MVFKTVLVTFRTAETENQHQLGWLVFNPGCVLGHLRDYERFCFLGSTPRGYELVQNAAWVLGFLNPQVIWMCSKVEWPQPSSALAPLSPDICHIIVLISLILIYKCPLEIVILFALKAYLLTINNFRVYQLSIHYCFLYLCLPLEFLFFFFFFMTTSFRTSFSKSLEVAINFLHIFLQIKYFFFSFSTNGLVSAEIWVDSHLP